ncbi:hypothetical protein MTR62_04220 [Novosphingobium sp. 1949]|uniref:Secreted protein n=1 Tax=Novosphingobium organovorum TaxID=2930092 RepID=A0ABT0BA02_9SPHN|nr:hypothetical protein [Novosphingobium organovorum]MCJ2181910.1 hypothetical protein [Novosphingobium organovorum]
MKLKKVLFAMTAGAVLVAPMAAQAGTTASASVGKIASVSGASARQSASIQKKKRVEAVVPILAAVAVVGGGVVVVDALSDDDDVSNGG